MIESRNDTLHNIPKNYWIWIYVGASKEPQFPHLGTFYIRKIQTFRGRSWLNTIIVKEKLTDLIYAFLICISNWALGLIHRVAFKRYTQIYALLYTVMFMMSPMDMFQILNNMYHKFLNVSLRWWFFG